MFGDRFSSSTTCSRWRHETEPGRLDQSLSCRFWKVATHPYGALRGPVEKLARDHNVILCSFGPKPSAIALFRLQREFPQCSLAYIGCKEYNPNYSVGLGDAISGSISWREGVE